MQRLGYSAAYIFDFLFQQEAGSSRQEMGYALHRSMGTMGYAEAIVYIQICQRS